jgi:hypothetical protein
MRPALRLASCQFRSPARRNSRQGRRYEYRRDHPRPRSRVQGQQIATLPLFSEVRALAEPTAMLATMPALLRVLPVLVRPGFLAGDLSTLPLRRYLATLGYNVHPWRLGRNREDVLVSARSTSGLPGNRPQRAHPSIEPLAADLRIPTIAVDSTRNTMTRPTSSRTVSPHRRP